MLMKPNLINYLDFEFFLHFNKLFIIPKFFNNNGSIFDPLSIINLQNNDKEIFKNIGIDINLELENEKIQRNILLKDLIDKIDNKTKLFLIEQKFNKQHFQTFKSLKIKSYFGSKSDPNYQFFEKELRFDDIKTEFYKYFDSGFENKRIFLWFDKLLFDKILKNDLIVPLSINSSAKDLQNIYNKINKKYKSIINFIRIKKCLNLTFFNFKFIESQYQKLAFKDNPIIIFEYFKQSDKDLIEIKNQNIINQFIPLINEIKNYFRDEKNYFINLDYTKPEIKKLDLTNNNPRIINIHMQKFNKSIINDKFIHSFLFQQQLYDFY